MWVEVPFAPARLRRAHHGSFTPPLRRVVVVAVSPRRYCSALTSHISGNTKSAVQSLISLYAFDTEPTTVTKAAGLFLTVAGSIGYSQVKYMEMKAKIQAEALSKTSAA